MNGYIRDFNCAQIVPGKKCMVMLDNDTHGRYAFGEIEAVSVNVRISITKSMWSDYSPGTVIERSQKALYLQNITSTAEQLTLF